MSLVLQIFDFVFVTDCENKQLNSQNKFIMRKSACSFAIVKNQKPNRMKEEKEKVEGAPIPSESTPPSARSRMMERMKTRHPDTEFADDDEDALYEAMNADMDADAEELSGLREREQKLVSMLENDPRTATFLASWMKGENPYVAMARIFGSDMFDLADDPEFADKMAEANKEYHERLAKSKNLEEEHKKNWSASMDMLDKLEDEGYPAEDLTYAIEKLGKIADDGSKGHFSEEDVLMVITAKNRDKDIEEARHEAEVKGRNAKIKEMKRNANSGDGVTALGGGTQSAPSNRDRGIFGLASEAR